MVILEALPSVALALSFLAIIIIPLSLWGVNVEKKFVETKNGIEINSNELIHQKKEMNEVEKEMKSKIRYLNGVQEKNHKEVMESLHNIQLNLKDKKDRD